MRPRKASTYGWICVAAAAALLLPAGGARAGAMLFAGRMDDGKFIPDKDVKAGFYTVRYAAITATVDDGAASAAPATGRGRSSSSRTGTCRRTGR